MGAIIKDLKLTEAGGSATELVTVADVKTYLQIEGTAYDGPLAIFISAARRLIEAYCSVSLFEKTAILTINTSNYKPFRLPQYPVESITSVYWKKCPSEWVELVADEDYSTFGEDNVWIESSDIGLHKVTYVLGVDGGHIWPQAIQAQAAFMFNNRDAKPGAIAPEVMALIQPETIIA